MDYSALADLLFPGIDTTPADIEARYPARVLPEGAKVTRMAPSRPALCIWATCSVRSRTSVSPTRAAAYSICASRTPTKSARCPARLRRFCRSFPTMSCRLTREQPSMGTTAFTGRTDSGSAHRSIRRMPNGLSGRVRHIHASARRTSLRRSARSRRNVRKISATTANGRLPRYAV